MATFMKAKVSYKNYAFDTSNVSANSYDTGFVIEGKIGRGQITLFFSSDTKIGAGTHALSYPDQVKGGITLGYTHPLDGHGGGFIGYSDSGKLTCVANPDGSLSATFNAFIKGVSGLYPDIVIEEGSFEAPAFMEDLTAGDEGMGEDKY